MVKKSHRKLRSQGNSKIFAQCKTKEYLGQNIGFMSEMELKYATPFSHGGQREVSCFPI